MVSIDIFVGIKRRWPFVEELYCRCNLFMVKVLSREGFGCLMMLIMFEII